MPAHELPMLEEMSTGRIASAGGSVLRLGLAMLARGARARELVRNEDCLAQQAHQCVMVGPRFGRQARCGLASLASRRERKEKAERAAR